MNTASQVVSNTLSMLAPLLQSQQNHGRQVSQTNALHEEAIRQAREHHQVDVEISRQFHMKELEIARAQHMQAISLEKELHEESVNLDRNLHVDSIERSLRCHREALEVAHQQHIESLAHSARCHLESLKQEYGHHLQKLAHDTETSRRENVRDVWSQKNGKLETLLITTTLMFACFFSMVNAGMPPDGTWPVLVTVFSIALSLSFLFLFLCVWFTMRAQAIMNKFDLYNSQRTYVCGERHTSCESYYQCHCATITRHADKCFYLGTMLLVMTGVFLSVARFQLWFDNPAASGIFTIVLVGGMVSLIFLHKQYPIRTRLSTEPLVDGRKKDE